VALLADLARRVTLTRPALSPQLGALAGFTAGLAWAVSPLLWGQATIVEVYALHALFCVALLWLLWRWGETREGGPLVLAGLLFGLGMGNHLTLALILPGALTWIIRTGRGTCGLRRTAGLAGLAALTGLLVYAYLPLAAAGGPPVNWGDPVTLDRFLWVVTGRLYAPLAFGLPLAELPARLAGWATTVVRQFAPWGLALALVGLWQLDRRLRAWWATTLFVWLAFTIYAIGYNSTDSDAYLLPAFAIMALWLAEGIAALLEQARRSRPLAAAAAVLLALALVAGPAFLRYWEEAALSPHLEAEVFWRTALMKAEPDALILTGGDARTFALWYAVYGLRARPDVAVMNVNLYGFEWYRRTLAETHPHLLPSDTVAPIDELIAREAAERPVYAAEDLDLRLEGISGTRTGVLMKLSP
jgi:4-amino-4-deoxy-L-arabinose transferase-like glycosyltransferase